MRIVVAPDKFKGTLTAMRAAEALARGTRSVYPHAAFALRPLADGGEGTLEAFVTARGGRIVDRDVTGPLSDRVVAPIAVLDSGETVIEMASASGLQLIGDPGPDSARRATSAGTGDLLLAATASDPASVIVGIGGSASTDGGTGAAAAAGWRFLDRSGTDLPAGGAALVALHVIEAPSEGRRPRGIVGACDVENPMVGRDGAAAAFASQKGAGRDDIALLEEGLERLAEVIARDLDVDIASIPHGGAGGGMGAGLVAFFGARLTSGFDLLADVVRLDDDVAGADMVITGEGRIDEHSLRGKAPIAVARRAAAYDVPVVAVAGDLAIEKSRLKKYGIVDAIGLVQSGAREQAIERPEAALAQAISGLLRHRIDNARGIGVRRRSRFLGG